MPRFLKAQEVLARMRAGDLPKLLSAGCWNSQFADGAMGGWRVMTRLYQGGHLTKPVGWEPGQPWTLNSCCGGTHAGS